MTALEMMRMVGKVVLISDGQGVQYEATIKDAKISYGKERYLVEPVAGIGQKWVECFAIKK